MHFRDFLWVVKNKKAYEIVRKLNSNKFSDVEYFIERILKYACKNVPFYHKYDIYDLSEFPILTKELIRKNYNQLLSINYIGKTKINFSGGSTGEPVPILQCEEYYNWVNAILFDYYNRNFEKSWQRATTLEIWGSPGDVNKKEGQAWHKKLKNIIYSSYVYNCFVFNEDDKKRCIEIINNKKPFFLKGYTNSLIELAEYIEKNDYFINGIEYILTRSSPLTNKARHFLERIFKGKIYDLYGSREVSAIAAEATFGNTNEYHVFNKNCFLEINENNEILVTNFHNYSMPIIRFNIGDKANLLSNKNNKQILGPIEGRSYAYIRFQNGINIHSQYFIAKFFNSSIYQFQVKQTAIDEIMVKYIDPYSELSNEFKNQFEEDIQEIAKLKIKFVWSRNKFIPKTINGKHLYVIPFDNH